MRTLRGAIEGPTGKAWLLVLLLVLSIGNQPAAAASEVEVFVTGTEQAVINGIVANAKESAGPFSNSLDQALAVLLAKAYPEPDASRLSRVTIVSLCGQARQQTGVTIDTAQSEAWVSLVTQTSSFDSVFKELSARGNGHVDQQRLIEAGLVAMLKAYGSDATGLLNSAQADELERVAKARESFAHERGVLGLKLDGWPVVEVLPDAPAAKAGMQDHDVVLAINGKDVTDIKQAADALKMLVGPPGGTVNLTVRRKDKILRFEITRVSAATAMISARSIKPDILYIGIPTFEGAGIAARVKHLVEENPASAILIDLRGNPGGRPEEANGVADLFLDNKQLQICQFREGKRIAFKSKAGAVAARVIVLTDHRTGSAAEMLAMALRDNGRATIVGETTTGALFGKDAAKLTGGETILFRTEPTVLSPTGIDYSATGIPPDLEVRDSRGPQQDAILERALELAGEPSHETPAPVAPN